MVYPDSQDERDKILIERGFTPGQHRLLSSGGVYDNNTSRIVAKLPGPKDINQTNAHDYHEKYRKLRISSMRQALQDETKQGFRGSLVLLGRAMVQEAIDGKGISKVKAAQLVYDHLELSPVANNQAAPSGVTVSDSSVMALRDIVQAIAAMRLGGDSTE